MSNVIRPINISSVDDSLIMSNQGTDCFLDLLICAAGTLPQTETQSKLISYLKERREINQIAPGTAGFDIVEMPWDMDLLDDDVFFLRTVVQTAQKDSTLEMLPYDVNRSIVLPWLEKFDAMLDEFIPLMAFYII